MGPAPQRENLRFEAALGSSNVLPGPWENNIQESGSFPFAQTVSARQFGAGDFPEA